MRWAWLILGVLAVLVGAVWTLQGLNILKDSAMSGGTMWTIIGIIVAVVGLVGIGVGVSRKRAPTA